jgi:uncharacterized protein YjgD (DUF1641 family)
MSQTDPETDAGVPLQDGEVAELAETIEANADELRELLELLTVLQTTAEELAPEVRTAVRENREPLEELRMAVEREELLVLLQQVGEHTDELTELLAMLETVEGLTADLTPELRRAIRENRDVLRRLREAVENEELLVLVERVGENAETLAQTLDLLEATGQLATDLVPELQDATGDLRPSIRQIRMVTAGFADATAGREIDPYRLGENLGHMAWFTQELGDPELLDTLDAGLGAFSEDDPDEVGLFGLLGALRERNVRRGMGRIVEFLRRMGAA